MINPRLSIDSMCTFARTFEQELALWQELGVRHAGLLISKVADDPGRKLGQLDDAGIGIATLIVGGFELADRSSWEANRATHRQAIDMVAAHKGHSIYFTSGRTVRCDWDEDFDLLAEAVAPTPPGGRAHIGEGELPLKRMMQDMLDACYDGVFDLEVVAPDFTRRIDEGELRRGIAAASRLLDEMGIQPTATITRTGRVGES